VQAKAARPLLRRVCRRTPKGKPLTRHSPVWRGAAKRDSLLSAAAPRRAGAALAWSPRNQAGRYPPVTEALQKKRRNGLPFPFPSRYDLTGKSSRSEGYDHEKHRGFGFAVCSVDYDDNTRRRAAAPGWCRRTCLAIVL